MPVSTAAPYSNQDPLKRMVYGKPACLLDFLYLTLYLTLISYSISTKVSYKDTVIQLPSTSLGEKQHKIYILFSHTKLA